MPNIKPNTTQEAVDTVHNAPKNTMNLTAIFKPGLIGKELMKKKLVVKKNAR